jgi:hypothetical protein
MAESSMAIVKLKKGWRATDEKVAVREVGLSPQSGQVRAA